MIPKTVKDPKRLQELTDLVENKVVIHEVITLCCYDKEVKCVSERIKPFDTEAEMHKYCAETTASLLEHGLAFNGSNAEHYYDYKTCVLTKAEKKFIFLNQL